MKVRALIFSTCVAALAACGQETRPAPGVELLDLSPEAPLFIDGQWVAWDGEAYAVAVLGAPHRDHWDKRLFLARVGPTGEVVTPPLEVSRTVDDWSDRFSFVVIDRAPSPRYLLVYFGYTTGDVRALEFNARGATLAGPYPLRPEGADEGLAVSAAFDPGADEGSVRVLFSSYGALMFGDEQGASEIGDPGVYKEDADLVYVPEAGQFLAFWEQDDRICVVPIAPDGSQLASPRVIADTGNAQERPEASVDESGGVLVTWYEHDPEGHTWALMGLDGDGASLWTEPLKPFPHNRSESLDVAVAVAGDGTGVLAWESDAETALSQIALARLDLEAGELTGEPALVSDPMFPAVLPAVAAAGGGLAVTFEGRVDAAERLFFTLAEPD